MLLRDQILDQSTYSICGITSYQVMSLDRLSESLMQGIRDFVTGRRNIEERNVIEDLSITRESVDEISNPSDPSHGDN